MSNFVGKILGRPGLALPMATPGEAVSLDCLSRLDRFLALTILRSASAPLDPPPAAASNSRRFTQSNSQPPPSSPPEKTYDVFISHNRADRVWVWEKLLPRLESAHLRVFTPDRDFIPGWPRRRNIDHALAVSRHTVAVLSPAFVQEDWDILVTMAASDADPLALQLKLLPLLLVECPHPEPITTLSLDYLDFTDERNWEIEFERLIRTVKAPLRSPPPPRVIKVLMDWLNILSSARNLLRLSLATLILVSLVLVFQLPALLPTIEKARQPPNGWLCPIWPAPVLPMPGDGTFNIAVAPFTRLDDADDASILTRDIQYFSQRLHTTIEGATKTEDLSPQGLPVKVRPPEEVRIACGQATFDPNPHIRGVEVENYAEANNVHLLIYGVITGTYPNYFVEPEFYISKELDDFNYGSEIKGSERLGAPVPLNLPLREPENWFKTQKKLHARSLALQYIIAGLMDFYLNDYGHAVIKFQKVSEEVPNWSDDEGKEVVHLLIGAAELRAYRDPKTEQRIEALNAAFKEFKRASELNDGYARSYLGLGAVAFQQATLEWPNTLDQASLLEAERMYIRGQEAEDQPPLAYVPIKAAYGLGQIHLAGYKYDPHWSKDWSQRFFNQVIAMSDGSQVPDLIWLAGNAHGNLCALADFEQNWSMVLLECQQAINLLKKLPEESQSLDPIYYAQVGFAAEKLNQPSVAQEAYNEAIRLGEGGYVSSEELKNWQAALDRLKKGNP